MTLPRAILPLPLLALVLACPSSPSGDDGVADSSSSEGGQTSVAPTTTASSTASSSTDPSSSTASTTTTDGSSSDEAASSDDTASSDDAASSDESSSGGPTNDCTDENDPCVLALDVTAAGVGGVDQFFVYTVGDGEEHVQLDAASGNYVSWFTEPWAFGCNADGSCCLSDGALCDKPLLQEFLELGPGDTAYVFVFANAPYELTITSG